jgi:hypothetical protein
VTRNRSVIINMPAMPIDGELSRWLRVENALARKRVRRLRVLAWAAGFVAAVAVGVGLGYVAGLFL